MKRSVISCAVLSAFILGSVALAFQSEDPLKAKVVEIVEAYTSGKLPPVITKYEALVKESPKDPTYHYLLAIAYLYADFDKKDTTFDKSYAELTAAKKLNPKMKYVNYTIGYILWARGRYDDAVTSYKTEISIDPSYAGNYYNLGLAYESLKKWDEAASQYVIAIDKDPKMAKAYNNLGAIYLNWKGDSFKALDNFKKAMELKPNVSLYRENYNKAVRKLQALRDSIGKGETVLPPDMVEKLKGMDLKEVEVAPDKG